MPTLRPVAIMPFGRHKAKRRPNLQYLFSDHDLRTAIVTYLYCLYQLDLIPPQLNKLVLRVSEPTANGFP